MPAARTAASMFRISNSDSPASIRALIATSFAARARALVPHLKKLEPYLKRLQQSRRVKLDEMNDFLNRW